MVKNKTKSSKRAIDNVKSLIKSGRLDEAKLILVKLTEKNPKDVEPWLELARITKLERKNLKKSIVVRSIKKETPSSRAKLNPKSAPCGLYVRRLRDELARELDQDEIESKKNDLRKTFSMSLSSPFLPPPAYEKPNQFQNPFQRRLSRSQSEFRRTSSSSSISTFSSNSMANNSSSRKPSTPTKSKLTLQPLNHPPPPVDTSKLEKVAIINPRGTTGSVSTNSSNTITAHSITKLNIQRNNEKMRGVFIQSDTSEEENDDSDYLSDSQPNNSTRNSYSRYYNSSYNNNNHNSNTKSTAKLFRPNISHTFDIDSDDDTGLSMASTLEPDEDSDTCFTTDSGSFLPKPLPKTNKQRNRASVVELMRRNSSSLCAPQDGFISTTKRKRFSSSHTRLNLQLDTPNDSDYDDDDDDTSDSSHNFVSPRTRMFLDSQNVKKQHQQKQNQLFSNSEKTSRSDVHSKILLDRVLRESNKKISLRHYGLGDELMRALCNHLAKLPTLQKLDLSNNCLHDNVLALLLSHFTTVMRLAETEKKMIKESPQLSPLAQSQCRTPTNLDSPVAFERINVIRKSSVTLPASVQFDLIESGIDHTHSSLRHLDLSHNEFGREAVFALCQFLEDSRNLSKLTLRSCGLGDKGCVMICKVLGRKHYLRTLILSENSISDEGGRSIAGMLAANYSLKRLCLRWNSIRSSSAQAIGQALLANGTLEDLDLGWNGLGDSGACSIGSSLDAGGAWLKRLGLAHNSIHGTGAFVLSHCLASLNSSLEYVDLSGNPIGYNGAQALVRSMHVFGVRLLRRLGSNAWKREPWRVDMHGCGFDSKDPRLFDAALPCGLYELDMNSQYDRTLAHALMLTCVQLPPAKITVWQIAEDNRRLKSTSPLNHRNSLVDSSLYTDSKLPPKPSRILPRAKIISLSEYRKQQKVEASLAANNQGNDDDSNKPKWKPVVVTNKQFTVPNCGYLKILFEHKRQIPTAREVMSAAGFESFQSCLESLPPQEAALLLGAGLGSIRMSASQAVQAVEAALLGDSDDEDKPGSQKIALKAGCVIKILPRLYNFHDCPMVIEKVCKNALESDAVDARLGQLRWFTPLNPSGNYKLNLNEEMDRILAVMLCEVNNTEMIQNKQVGRGDTSQHGTWSWSGDNIPGPLDVDYVPLVPAPWQNFRNEKYRGSPVILTNAFFDDLPHEGWLEFDYVSTSRPPVDALPIAKRDLLDLIEICDFASCAVKLVHGKRKMMLMSALSRLNNNGGSIGFTEVMESLANSRHVEVLNRLKYHSSQHYFTCVQVAAMLCDIPSSLISLKEEALVVMFSRILDIDEFMNLTKTTIGEENIAKMAYRLGWLNILNPMRSDAVYDLDLSNRDHHELAELMIRLAEAEPGKNFVDEHFQKISKSEEFPGWELPLSWTEPGGVPRGGRLQFRYTGCGEGCVPDWKVRRELVSFTLLGSYRTRISKRMTPTIAKFQSSTFGAVTTAGKRMKVEGNLLPPCLPESQEETFPIVIAPSLIPTDWIYKNNVAPVKGDSRSQSTLIPNPPTPTNTAIADRVQQVMDDDYSLRPTTPAAMLF